MIAGDIDGPWTQAARLVGTTHGVEGLADVGTGASGVNQVFSSSDVGRDGSRHRLGTIGSNGRRGRRVNHPPNAQNVYIPEPGLRLRVAATKDQCVGVVRGGPSGGCVALAAGELGERRRR